MMIVEISFFSPTNDALLTNPLAEIVPGAQVDETKRYRIFNSFLQRLKSWTV
ncbi:MAG: hypothetical protein R2822_13075 [Spirosomataceae bacterium]